MKDRLLIVDIDGCIADCKHRLHWIVGLDGKRKHNPDWDAFLSRCVYDRPIRDVIEVVNNLREQGFYVALVTGREEPYRLHTVKWLDEHKVFYDILIMRRRYDRRHDKFMKLEAYYTLTARDSFRAVIVFDDRDSVIEAFRLIGVTAFQTAKSTY